MLIAVLNQKGGVGKSTTAVHLARWLQLQALAERLEGIAARLEALQAAQR